MNNGIAAPPDLLRRFVPTSHISAFSIGDIRVRLETNDPAMITALQARFDSPLADCAGAQYLWKLIREEEATGSGPEITILSSLGVSTILLGTKTVVVIDYQRHEVLGFIAADISADQFVSILTPVVRDLIQKAGAATREDALRR
jgi:hypothetical protein